MNPTLRRVALVLVLLTEAVLPYWFDRLGIRDTGRFGPTPPDGVFLLDIVWIILLVWSVVAELPALERNGGWGRQRPWVLAVAAAAGAICLDRIFWSTVGHDSSRVAKVHHAAVVHSAVAAGLPALVVLISRALRKPINVSRTPMRHWFMAVALVILWTPPFMKFAKMGGLIVLIVAIWMKWVQDLPSREAKPGARKWRIRSAALALAVLAFAAGQAIVSRFYHGGHFENWEPRRAGVLVSVSGALVLPSLGLIFVVLCVSAADGLAWSMRRSTSVRARMLALGLFCAALALALSRLRIDDALLAFAPLLRPEVRDVLQLVLLGVMVYIFSVTTSRGLARSLEQSVRAISEIGRGNLEVTLDDSGRDEVAAVARSVNQMVEQLREAEFLERINADLRSRSTQLTQTLEALRNAQADLVRSERMASVATLVKGIAHELNNPINYVAGNMAPLKRYCEFLTRVATELADGRARGADEVRQLTRLSDRKDLGFVTEDLARLTADIGEGARRAQLIITDLQSLTSAAQRGIERVDLHRIVRQTISLLKPRVPPGVTLETRLSPVATLPARAGQLEQVLVNLTDNALRAVGEKGTVRISVDTVDSDAVVKVTDDGPGMSAEVKQQAFEPFFTTRPAGEGSGLGLAIVASIVRGHRGIATIKSEHGEGTEVELRLPFEADLLSAPELVPPSR
ncbi:MAG: ATP-binding protein [Myxococcales bacterium]